MGLKLQRTTHPKCHCHRLEHPDDCPGESKENNNEKQEDSLLDVTQIGRSIILALPVGVLVVELWHGDQAAGKREDEEANGDEDAPTAGNDKGPGN